MRNRQKLNRKKSKKLFKKGARNVNKKNRKSVVMRGGIRL